MLIPCPRCQRHVRTPAACPFCGESSPRPSSAQAARGLGVPLAIGLALTACGAPSQTESSTPEEDTRNAPPPAEEPTRPVPAYGAAPLPPEDEASPENDAPPPEEGAPASAYGGPPVPDGPSQRLPPRR